MASSLDARNNHRTRVVLTSAQSRRREEQGPRAPEVLSDGLQGAHPSLEDQPSQPSLHDPLRYSSVGNTRCLFLWRRPQGSRLQHLLR
ncbi:hypothetical protein CGRA01v4_14607 [Colletotrichum graminicola]|nr:hypothetical protein CGRA01v4_14607 [Colletotrichum graminicola]